MIYAPNTIDRLLAKTVPVSESGCLIFTGSLDTSGYGLIGIGGSGNIAKAHRVMFHHANGYLPDDMQVLHRCDVRCCVNPDHLWLGSLNDNMRDRNQKGRQAHIQGEDHGCHKLTEGQVVEIRRLHETGRFSQRKIAAMFGMSRGAIVRIVNGTGWKHITEGFAA